MSGKHWEGGRQRDVRHAGCNWGGGAGSHVLERGRRTFDEHWLGGAAAGVVKMLLTSMSSAMTPERYSCSGAGYVF
jgi:hypothetical protein